MCPACVAPSDSEENTRSPAYMLGVACQALSLPQPPLCRPPPHLLRVYLKPQLALSRSPSNLLYVREFVIPTGRARCHGNVSLPTLRPAQEAKSFPAKPAWPPRLQGPALPCGRKVWAPDSLSLGGGGDVSQGH